MWPVEWFDWLIDWLAWLIDRLISMVSCHNGLKSLYANKVTLYLSLFSLIEFCYTLKCTHPVLQDASSINFSSFQAPVNARMSSLGTPQQRWSTLLVVCQHWWQNSVSASSDIPHVHTLFSVRILAFFTVRRTVIACVGSICVEFL